MNITEAREELRDLLTEAAPDARVAGHVPEELPTPGIVIDAADDYLTIGETFARGDADLWLTLRVYVLVDLVANEQATEDLEELLALVVPALLASDWTIAGITRPGPFTTTEWLAHGVAITVRNLVNL